MKIPFPEKLNQNSLFLWLMHRISAEFDAHAILKGGMALRLLGCDRQTVDLDYVFVPFSSKKEIGEQLKTLCKEIPNATIRSTMNSKAMRIHIEVQGVQVQVEVSVSEKCKSVALSTEELSREVDELGRIIRVMSFDVALAHKLAAWNERRLIRDLFDAWFLFVRLKERPDLEILQARLAKIQSRRPELKKVKKMSLQQFGKALEEAAQTLTQARITEELGPLLPKRELAGLDVKMKTGLMQLRDCFGHGATPQI